MCENGITAAGSEKGKRIVSIELLRIISMILIIAYHFSVHGGLKFEAGTISAHKLWIQFLEFGGKTGVNIFILITGYFGITSKKRNNLRLIKLWLAVFFYSAAIYALSVIWGGAEFSKLGLIKNILPITFSVWWFATAYFMLCLMAPFLNKLLNTLSRSDYLKMLGIMTVCWCLTSTFLTVDIECNNFLWFVYVYSVAGYIRLYGVGRDISAAKYFLLSAAFAAIAFSSVLIFDVIGIKYPVFAQHATYFLGMKKLPALLISLSIFMAFLKLNIKSGKIITLLSPAMFGVYLLHDNTYIRVLIWNKIFKVQTLNDAAFLIPYTLAAVALVFAVCSLIELARIYLLENNYTKALSKLIDKISAAKLFNKTRKS